MTFFSDLSLGYRNYLSAFSFIIKHGLWKYLIAPLILFAIIFYTGYYFEELRELNSTKLENGEIGFFSMIWTYIKLGFDSVMAFLLLDATKYLVMILLSPLLAFLSEKVEHIITSNEYAFNLKQLIKDVKRGVGIAIRMLIAETIIIYLIWHPLAYIIGLSDSFFTSTNGLILFIDLIIGFYFYGFGYLDYINERMRLSVKDSWNFVKKHAGLAIAIGSVFSLLFYIPELIDIHNKLIDTFFDNIGVLIAPVWAIVAATLAMHELVDLNNSQYAVKKEK